MEEKIRLKLEDLEKEKGIRILFAVESGSRIWGMQSKNSDYDVRGVYYRPLNDYLTVRPKREIIEFTSEDKMIDIVLFDIFKFSKLLSSSNPNLIDWLSSDIIYKGKIPTEYSDFAHNQFNPITLYHHYKSMAKTNYMKYIHSGALVTYKKYLYVFRGLVNSMYVSQFKEIAPIKIEDAIRKVNIPENIREEMLRIIDLKKKGEEQQPVERIKLLDDFIHERLNDLSDEPFIRKNNTFKEIDNVIQRKLK